MRLLIQRIESAEVRVNGEVVGRTGRGLCLFVGVAAEDPNADADFLAEKAIHLRIFEDAVGKLNRSVSDIQGDISSCRSSRCTAIAAKDGVRLSAARLLRKRRGSFMTTSSASSKSPAFEWRPGA